MPLPIFNLGVQLWQAAFPSLSKVCQLHPPTACQMLLYYDIFGPNGGYMNRHRDNFKSRDAVNALIRGKDAWCRPLGAWSLTYLYVPTPLRTLEYCTRNAAHCIRYS